MVPCQEILAKAQGRRRRHHRPVGPDHAVRSRRWRTSPREMQRDDYFRVQEDPAADRRRDDQPRAHRGEDRAALRRPGGLRAGRVALGRRCARACCRDERATQYIAEIEADYERIREQHANKKALPMVTLAEARANKTHDRLGELHAAEAEVHRPARVQELRPGRARALHRLGPVLPDLGSGRPVSRRS